MKKPVRFNKNIIIPVTILFIVLTAFSCMADYAREEGTLSTGPFNIFLLKNFAILQFPICSLFGNNIEPLFFWAALLVNCFLYAFLIERLVSFFLKRKAGA
jgi:hypothetical protein